MQLTLRNINLVYWSNKLFKIFQKLILQTTLSNPFRKFDFGFLIQNQMGNSGTKCIHHISQNLLIERSYFLQTAFFIYQSCHHYLIPVILYSMHLSSWFVIARFCVLC